MRDYYTNNNPTVRAPDPEEDAVTTYMRRQAGGADPGTVSPTMAQQFITQGLRDLEQMRMRRGLLEAEEARLVRSEADPKDLDATRQEIRSLRDDERVHASAIMGWQSNVEKSDPERARANFVTIYDPRGPKPGEEYNPLIHDLRDPTPVALSNTATGGTIKLDDLTPTAQQIAERQSREWTAQLQADVTREGHAVTREEIASRDALGKMTSEYNNARLAQEANLKARDQANEGRGMDIREKELQQKEDQFRVKDAGDRLQTMISTMNSRDTRDYEAWISQGNWASKTYESVMGFVRDHNNNLSREVTAEQTALVTQRGADMAAAADIAKSKKDEYDKHLASTIDVPEQWFNTMMKGMAVVAAGKVLPGDFLKELGGIPPARVQDQDVYAREYARALGVPFENPMLPTIQQRRYQESPMPTQPSFGRPPQNRLSDQAIQQSLVPSWRDMQAEPTVTAPSVADAITGSSDEETNEPYGQPEEPESTAPVGTDIGFGDANSNGVDDTQEAQPQEESSLMRAASLPFGEDPNVQGPDPEGNLIDFGSNLLLPVAQEAYQEGGPEYIGRIGAMMGGISQGLSVEDAGRGAWEGTPYADWNFNSEEDNSDYQDTSPNYEPTLLADFGTDNGDQGGSDFLNSYLDEGGYA